MADYHTDKEADLTQTIIDEYRKENSIARVAKKLNTTQVKVQRVLITEDLWTSKRTRQIAEMRQQGLSVEEIAEILGKDVKTIQTFLPYSRGQYGNSGSDDAIRSKDYRERMRTAAEGMAFKEDVTVEKNNIIDLGDAFRNKMDDTDINTIIKAEKERLNAKTYTVEEPTKSPFLSNDYVFRLKLQLVDHFRYGGNENLGMKPAERKEFLKLAKAKEGISREVLVPGSMNLHAMHYMIQRLFGWQNSHLHHFSIRQEDFDALTGGTVGGWENLCGSLLHFPADDSADFYWDDDYKEGKSVKSWLKKKYVGPYVHKAVCDTYYAAQREVADFQDCYPEFVPEMALEEMDNRIIMEEDLNFLSERLTLSELLTANATKTEKERKAAYKIWLKQLDIKKKETDEKISGLSKRKRKDLDQSSDALKIWRMNRSRVEKNVYYGMADELEAQTGRSALEWLDEADYLIPFFERQCKKLFTEYNPKLTPLFDTLHYEYDYGDGWCVKITVLNQYDRKTNADLDVKERPRCVAADGLNLVDDVGGIYGFKEMLEILAGGDQEEKESMKAWARGLGWTGKMEKVENMI